MSEGFIREVKDITETTERGLAFLKDYRRLKASLKLEIYVRWVEKMGKAEELTSLDFVINVLLEHEKALDEITKRLEKLVTRLETWRWLM